MNDGFIDLRSPELGSENFWPSFTDIMTVVVMIFLLTTTVLMVRNWELIDQLRNSIIAEQHASEVILSTNQENATLEEQLAHAENETSMLRMQLMDASEQNTRLASTVNDRDQQIVLILSEKQQLQTDLADKEQKITLLDNNIIQRDDELASIKTNLIKSRNELKSSQDLIVILQQEKVAQTQQLSSLEDNYGSLKIKYEKLIRPARSAKGKYVVSVSYQINKGKTRIRFKEVSQKNHKTLTIKQLHKELAILKKKHPKSLYIKIVIPKNSGLTYSDAWTFMKGLLEKYDYYYQ
ncbi:MAG: hypothetical protein DIZ80_09715 [endosymbiont of Galathealinum brachiosum]|uniref:Uncharacterized protein n=1 Tax=endosymbiont of Galathealinum brachiosum TaxID=2200906 RepID=A0A370DCB2_9GAMM|nr:MAG: hypothetical protein DIZ80_09715 [endosymbiont of Galathealinum brachiosum]